VRGDRGARLLALLPDAERWARVSKPTAPSGYVCVFYGARSSPRCEPGEVRVVGRLELRAEPGDGCSDAAALYFAPMRAPNRPEPDRSGIRGFESDGTVFLYAEIDDYVIEMEACPERGEQMRRYIAEWSNRAAEAEP
jgi:hypothetical protein